MAAWLYPIFNPKHTICELSNAPYKYVEALMGIKQWEAAVQLSDASCSQIAFDLKTLQMDPGEVQYAWVG